jgi:endo-1,4-beta-xylanase
MRRTKGNNLILIKILQGKCQNLILLLILTSFICYYYLNQKIMRMRLLPILFIMLMITGRVLFGQNEPVIIEAESGTLGSDYGVLTDGAVTYITPQTNFLSSTNPNTSTKVASYTVVFSDSGTYKLFLRVRVGSAAADDDSFFEGNGFGTKDPAADDDWIICNQLHTAGFTIPEDVVEGQGGAATGLWKWLSVSDFTGNEPPITFRVETTGLTQTFEIGARENGFDVDKIAFGRAGIYYTVDNLDKGEAGSVDPPGEEPIGPPLADGLDKFLGCSFGSYLIGEFEGYWNQVTPENAGKWGSVEGTRDVMNWSGLDQAYQFAKDNGFVYKQHVLVWGNQQPSWMAALDSAEQHAELEEWFSEVAARYPDMDQIEVVNEPLHDPPDDAADGGYIGALGGTGETGWDWVIEAFRMADAVFPDTTLLMINEYSVTNDATSAARYLEIIRLLQQDTLVDAIGFQGHWFSQNASSETILRNIDSLATTGLPIYVTEMDLQGLTDLQHVNNYMRLFPLYWEHPAIQGITLWGYKPGMWSTDQGAFLIDANGVERPAMLWLRAYLKNEFVPNESITISTSTGQSSIDIDDGTLQMLAEVLPDTTTLETVHWTVSNTKIATIDQTGLLKALSNGTITVRAISLEYQSDVSDEMEITISGQLGIETIAGAENIRIYPNPSDDGCFTIDGMEGVSSVAILDMYGHQIISQNVLNQSSVTFDISLPAGIYIVRLSDGIRYYHDKITVN